MADPIYKGQANATTITSWFGSWFGGSPAYKSAPEVAASNAIAAPSAVATSADALTYQDAQRPIVIVVPREVREVCEVDDQS